MLVLFLRGDHIKCVYVITSTLRTNVGGVGIDIYQIITVCLSSRLFVILTFSNESTFFPGAVNQKRVIVGVGRNCLEVPHRLPARLYKHTSRLLVIIPIVVCIQWNDVSQDRIGSRSLKNTQTVVNNCLKVGKSHHLAN